MKQWNGMVRKEWVTMKWPLIVSALVAITVMAVFPFLITGFLATEVHVFEFALVICFLWAGASVFAPVIALFTMLGSEMKRPDVWLHSNASIFKLIGSKAFMALMIGVGGLLIPTTVLAVHYALSKSTMFSFDELLFFGTIFIVIMFCGFNRLHEHRFFLLGDQSFAKALCKRFFNRNYDYFVLDFGKGIRSVCSFRALSETSHGGAYRFTGFKKSSDCDGFCLLRAYGDVVLHG